jgi:predicted nucleic acid-binding protein
VISVIDASVAIKWFVNEEEGRNEAALLLSAIEKDPRAFAVPELFFNEMLAVLCKLSLSWKDIISYLHLLEELGIARIGNGSELLAMAARLAREHRISGYDAVYAAAAKLLEGTWITADREAHKRIRDLGISRPL